MSGGHFCNNSYPQYQVHQFADELENAIQNNNTPNEYDYCPKYNQEVIDYLKTQVDQLRKTAEIMKAIDYLFAGDHAEDSFLEEIQRIEKKFKLKKSKKVSKLDK